MGRRGGGEGEGEEEERGGRACERVRGTYPEVPATLPGDGGAE